MPQTRTQYITSRKEKQWFQKLFHVYIHIRVHAGVLGPSIKYNFSLWKSKFGIHTISSAFESLEWCISNYKYIGILAYIYITLEVDQQQSVHQDLQIQEQA